MKVAALLRGIEQADSVALDPHKTLFLPYGTGAVLVRDGRLLLRTRSAPAPTISGRWANPRSARPRPTSRPSSPAIFARCACGCRCSSPALPPSAPRSPRSSRSPAISTPACPRSTVRAGPAPQLSVVAFRYLPKSGDVDDFNERLMRHIQQEGRVMMSGTRIDGSYRLRCAILCFRTHIEHVDDAVDVVIRRRGNPFALTIIKAALA